MQFDTFENLLFSLVSVSWKHSFLDIYRCIERLFSISFLRRTRAVICFISGFFENKSLIVKNEADGHVITKFVLFFLPVLFFMFILINLFIDVFMYFLVYLFIIYCHIGF